MFYSRRRIRLIEKEQAFLLTLEEVGKLKNYQIYFVLVFIMLIWGFNVTAIKLLVSHFPPVTVTALRILTAGLFITIILAFLKEIRIPAKKEFGMIFLGALLSVVGHHYFLSVGLTSTSAVNGGLILGMGPLLTALLALIFFRRMPTPLRIIGFLLGGLGVAFTILSGNKGLSEISSGDYYVFLSILSQAFSFIVINKATKTLPARLLTGYMMVMGGALLFAIGLFTEPGGLDALGSGTPGIWVIFCLSAIFATAIGHMIYNHAIGKVGAAEASIFINLSTFFSLVGAAIFLGEAIKPSHGAGFILILAGVIFGSGAFEELLLKHKARKQQRYSA